MATFYDDKPFGKWMKNKLKDAYSLWYQVPIREGDVIKGWHWVPRSPDTTYEMCLALSGDLTRAGVGWQIRDNRTGDVRNASAGTLYTSYPEIR
jgi:hypothetical protein